MVSTHDRSAWFKKFAFTVREIVVAHGGAIVMTQEELRTAVLEEDSSFQDCPTAVLFHPTMPLRKWAQLEVGGFTDLSNDVLVIHFGSMSMEEARARCEQNGLSEAVNIALMERLSA